MANRIIYLAGHGGQGLCVGQLDKEANHRGADPSSEVDPPLPFLPVIGTYIVVLGGRIEELRRTWSPCLYTIPQCIHPVINWIQP